MISVKNMFSAFKKKNIFFDKNEYKEKQSFFIKKEFVVNFEKASQEVRLHSCRNF